jgi:NADH-quinone oxidoreductase subunit A
MIKNYYLNDYFLILLGVTISFIFVCVVFLLSYILVPRYYYSEKISPYECGFDPFDEARSNFEVRFYLVAILFIVFDLEIIFLIPWVLTLNYIGAYGFYVGLVFLFILTVGFIYEIVKGAVDANQS